MLLRYRKARAMHRRTYQSKMTAEDHEALEAFAREHGHTWKAELRNCFMRASYPGMSDEHAATLQALRNRRGPSFLTSYRILNANT